MVLDNPRSRIVVWNATEGAVNPVTEYRWACIRKGHMAELNAANDLEHSPSKRRMLPIPVLA
jgi:hypothetical protein